MAHKDTSYHVAIDGQGYVLSGSPDNPRRSMELAPVFGQRFATGDRDYSDFSLWWFWAQTDWSQGIAESQEWQDNAKYWYANNIDAFTEASQFRLVSGFAVSKDFDDGGILCSGMYGDMDGVNYHFVGTRNLTPNIVYRKSGANWADITTGGGAIGNGVDYVWYIMSHAQKAWFFTEDNAADNSDAVISTANASDFTDHATAIKTAMSWSNLHGAICGVEVGGVLYVSIVDKATVPWTWGIVYTNDGGTTWTKLLDVQSRGMITAMATDGTDIYYMVSGDDFHDFYYYSIAGTANVLLRKFFQETGRLFAYSSFFPNSFVHELNGKIVISAEPREVWEYDPATAVLTRKFRIRSSLSGTSAFLAEASKKIKNEIHWSKLLYNGSSFHTYKTMGGEVMMPLYTDGTNMYYRSYGENRDILYVDSGYEATEDTNYIEFCEEQTVPSINKLANSATITFSPLTANQEVEIKYSIDGGSTFTSLGTASHAVDGGTITQKSFLFGDAVSYYKIIFRVYLNGTSTTTPTIKDISFKYLPMPEYKYRWSFRIDSLNNLLLLDNKSKEPMTGADIRHKIRTSFLKKQIVELEDIDYAETTINDADPAKTDTTITVDSTEGFPDQGRLKIGDEEILYTGKTRTTFTGCTRGYRGTNAANHADNDVVSNKYKAIIINYREKTPLSNKSNPDEFTIDVDLIEA